MRIPRGIRSAYPPERAASVPAQPATAESPTRAEPRAHRHASNEARPLPISLAPGPGLAVTKEHPGRYVVHDAVRELGRGGIGRVFVAVDQHLGREVAIKELLLENDIDGRALSGLEQPVARFLREARVTGQLEHPNIVPVYELGRRSDGRLYYTMRIVRGQTLAAVIARTPKLDERLRLIIHFSGLCQAIAYAHSRGVVHRDIKPENVMIGEFGETVVLDWGLAKLIGMEDAADPQESRPMQLSSDSRAERTVTGNILGTPAYMSPEQALGHVEEIDARSDVWSLGAVLYTILARRPPFKGADVFATLAEVLKGRFRPLRQIDRDIPADLAAIVGRALQRDKLNRYQTAKELVQDIEAYQAGTRVKAYEYSSFELTRRFLARNRIAAFVALAALSLILALSIGAYRRVVHARDRALQAEAWARNNERNAQRTLAEALNEKASTALGEGDTIAAELFAAKALTLDERPDARGIVIAMANELKPVPVRNERHAIGCSMYAMSGTGERLACLLGNEVEIWASGNSAAVSRWKITGAPSQLSISKDSRTLLLATSDGDISIWDIESHAQRIAWRADAKEITAATLSGSGLRAASAESSGHVVIWDAVSGRELARTKAREAVTSLAFSPDENALAVGGRFGEVRVWKWAEPNEQQPLQGHEGTVLSLQFSPSGKYLASGGSDRSVHIWDLRAAKPAGAPLVSSGPVSTLAWAPNGTYLAYGASDKTLRLAQLGVASPPLQLRGHDAELSALAFSKDSRQLTSLSADVGPQLWSLQSPRTPSRLSEPGNVLSLAVVGTDEILSAGLGRNGVCFWRLSSKTCSTRLPSSTDRVRSLAVSKDRKLLAFGGSDGRIFVWNLQTMLPQQVLEAHRGEIRSVAFSSDSSLLASGGTDGLVRVFSMPAGKLSAVFEAHSAVNAVAFRPGSAELVSAGRDGILRFWHAGAGRELGELKAHEDWIFGIAFSNDGRWLATAGGDRVTRVWNVQNRSKRYTLVGHQARVLSVAFSPDADFIASASEDSSVRIWSLASGRERALLRGHEGAVRTLGMSADGSVLASGGDDGTVRLWPLVGLEQSAEQLLEDAEKRYLMRVTGTKLTFESPR